MTSGILYPGGSHERERPPQRTDQGTSQEMVKTQKAICKEACDFLGRVDFPEVFDWSGENPTDERIFGRALQYLKTDCADEVKLLFELPPNVKAEDIPNSLMVKFVLYKARSEDFRKGFKSIQTITEHLKLITDGFYTPERQDDVLLIGEIELDHQEFMKAHDADYTGIELMKFISPELEGRCSQTDEGSLTKQGIQVAALLFRQAVITYAEIQFLGPAPKPEAKQG